MKHPAPNPLTELQGVLDARAAVNAIADLVEPTDEQRRRYNANVFIPHEATERLLAAVQAASAINVSLDRPERRRIVTLDGDYMAGKSALIAELVAALMDSNPPEAVQRDGCRTTTQPVIVVQSTSDGQRGLMRATAAALGIPYRGSPTANDLLDSVVIQLRLRDIRVVVFDDANLLKSARGGEALTAFLRRAVDQMAPSTVLFAGKDLHNSPIGAGSVAKIEADRHAAQQLARRTTTVRIDNVSLDGLEDAQRWRRLVDRAATRYLLQQEGMSGLDAEDLVWLHGVTGGRLGEMYQLLGLTAASAVGDEERLTRTGLDEVHQQLVGDSAAIEPVGGAA